MKTEAGIKRIFDTITCEMTPGQVYQLLRDLAEEDWILNRMRKVVFICTPQDKKD